MMKAERETTQQREGLSMGISHSAPNGNRPLLSNARRDQSACQKNCQSMKELLFHVSHCRNVHESLISTA